MRRELPDFGAEVRRLVEPLAASPARKRVMEEELVAHLIDAYVEELSERGDSRAALRAVRRRFGVATEIGLQLQAAVPRGERAIFSWLGHLEDFMARWWIAGLVVFLIVFAVAVPESVGFSAGAITMLLVLGAAHECQHNPFWRAHWPWLAGVAGIAVGPAIILPALAKYKETHDAAQAAGPTAIGGFILLAGFAVIIWALAFRKKPLA